MSFLLLLRTVVVVVVVVVLSHGWLKGRESAGEGNGPDCQGQLRQQRLRTSTQDMELRVKFKIGRTHYVHILRFLPLSVRREVKGLSELLLCFL